MTKENPSPPQLPDKTQLRYEKASFNNLKDIATIRVPQGCLFKTKNLSFLQDLEQFAEQLHRNAGKINGVLLIQSETANDSEEEWLHELESEILLSWLVDRIDTFRWILSLIRNSPKPWIYMGASDCLGSAWDLALSCQRRYWFEPDAKVGYPEIISGGFPPGGVLDSLNKKDIRTREKWKNKPIYSAAEAQSEGYIDFCSKASLWETEAVAVCRELLANNPLIGVRENQKQRKKRSVGSNEKFDLNTSIVQRKAAFEQIENLLKNEFRTTDRRPLAWEYCWQLVNERSKIHDSLVFGRLIAHIVARHYLTPSYHAWLTAYITCHSDPCFLLTSGKSYQPEITIDLNHIAPPTEILIRLLRYRCSLIFGASDPQILSSGLNIMYGRIERTLGAHLARKYWDSSVSWYLTQEEEIPGSCVMTWTTDDHFVLRLAGIEANFRRIESNASTALPGVLEWYGDTLPESLAHLLPLVSDGALKIPLKADGRPISVLLRSIFFEEMIRISRHADGEIAGLTAALREHKWRFAGDDDSWDRFLKNRFDQNIIQSPAEDYLLPMTKASWEIGAWKHARALAKRKAHELTFRRWNKTALSQHMAIFLGMITKNIAQKLPRITSITFDHIACEALGFPEEYGTPLKYIQDTGVRRVQFYTKQHWPLFLK